MKIRSIAAPMIVMLLALNATWAAGTDSPTPVEPHSGWNFSEAGLVPVQSGGRLKPFDSYSREMVLYLTGSRTFQGWNPVDLMFSWLTFPTTWDQVPFIQVGREDVRRQLGLDEKKSLFTPHDLIGNFALAQYASEIEKSTTVTAPTGAMQKQDQRQQELKRVLERVGVFRSIVSGEGWPLIPQEQPKSWLSIASNEPGGKFIRTEFVDMVKAYQAGDATAFKRNSVLVRAAVEGEITGFSEGNRHEMEAESLYNRINPFMYAWIFYLIAALAWFTCIARAESIIESNDKKDIYSRIAAFSMGLAVLAHVGGFGLRCYIAGRPPVTNMYESVIWVSFGVVVFATVIYFVSKRQMIALAVACSLATLGLVAAAAAPAILDPGIHPLVPVLRSNYWLTIHVLTITLGYAAFFL